MRFVHLAMVLVPALVAACGDEPKGCDPIAQTGCEDGLVCEEVTEGAPACFAPVVVRGMVFDLSDGGPVAGARIVALDANGAPASSVAVSDAAGEYELQVPALRGPDGTPAGRDVTLRADAAAYQTFPSGLRQAVPIDTSSPVEEDGTLVVQSALTDIGLLPLPAGAGTASIHGTVALPPDRAGVLVVAETAAGGRSAIADRDGDYAIFNLDPGSYTVAGYAQGASYVAADVTLAAGQDAVVDLSLSQAAPGTVSGTIQIVNAPGGSMTSVILVVESTFDETLARGDTPPGLRAPPPGTAPDVAGEYLIEGVPAGRYVVLAAFENDGLVRDPDLSIGGTSILHVEVASGQGTVVDGFKVTEALAVLGPGANGPEAVSGPPTFRWKDDSSEDEYDLTVFDAYGNIVWETTEPGHSGSDPAVPYSGGAALETGMYYQFRVTSLKNGVPISRTEDLTGVFYL